MRYRSVWITETFGTAYGKLTTLKDARLEVEFLKSQGRIAWVQDEEDNRIKNA